VVVLNILEDEELGREAYRVINLVKEKYRGERGYIESVRNRCRQLYGYLFRAGILSTIAYVYAKGGENLVKTAFRWMTADSELPPRGSEEDVGYAIYAASFCRLLEKVGFPTDGASLGKVIEALTSNPATTMIVEEQSLRFARWLKKLAEALLSAE
jgi:CRISPR type III-B/RAMP module-associated protein Cmr5